jgi:hypothetical protein
VLCDTQKKRKKMAAISFDDSAFNKLYPPNTIVHLVMEVARCKKIFQHEDNARTTSCFVETFFSNAQDLVGKGWLPSGDAAAEAEKEIAKTPRRGKPLVVPPWKASPSSTNNVTQALIQQTKTVTESADPFFNHPFEFVFNPKEDGLTAEGSVATFRFRVCDANYEPNRPIVIASVNVPFSKTGKGELTLACALDPELSKAVAATEAVERPDMNSADIKWPDHDASVNGDPSVGSIIIRYSVKITKPRPPDRDPEADVDLATLPTTLTGETPVLQIPQEGYGIHTVLPGLLIFTDPEFTLKLNKAMIKILGGLFDEENAAKSPGKKRSGGGGLLGSSTLMSQSRRGAGGEETSAANAETIDKVVQGFWKCKRSHQVHTKARLCAERCLRHETVLAFTSDEEMEYKLWWKQQAALLDVGVTGPQLANLSSALRLMYDKIWVLMVCGDDETESGSLWTPNFEQRTKLQYAGWGPSQYAALQAAFIKLVLPTISDKAALEIGVEDFKADDITQESMIPQPNSSRVVGSGAATASLNASANNNSKRTGSASVAAAKSPFPALADFGEMILPFEKQFAPVRGDQAYKIFQRQTSDFLHRWAATMTETEQITLLKATVGTIQTFARPYAGFQTEKPKKAARSERRASRSRRT